MSAGLAAAISWFGYHCGSGFATGRQIVQYTTRHGWAGAWIPIGIWAILACFAYLAIDFAYLTRSKDYKDFNLGFYAPIGKITVAVWDVIVILSAFVVLGSVIATAGELFQTALGLNYWVGVFAFVALMLVFEVWGYNFISKLASVVTVPMILLIILTIILGVSHNFDNLKQVMSQPAIVEGDSIKSMLKDMVTYASNQAAFLPAFIAISYSFTQESDVKVFAFGGAFLNMLIHFSMGLLVFSAYPWVNSESLVVLSIVKDLPWGGLAVVYQITIFLALVSTAVTFLYGTLSRFNTFGKKFIPDETKRKVFWAAVFLFGSVFISSFGLSAIVNKGYKVTGTLRLPVMVLPIIVLGLWRVHQAKKKRAAEAAE